MEGEATFSEFSNLGGVYAKSNNLLIVEAISQHVNHLILNAKFRQS